MTDKVQKIREEVERLKEETSIGLSEHENGVEQGRMEIINALSLFLDSLQEEPVRGDFEMALAEMIDNAQKRVVEPWVVAAQWKDELIKLAKSEEPISEELEEALKAYPPRSIAADYDTINRRDAFEFGYLKAEKDLELTWEDIEFIVNIDKDADNEESIIGVRSNEEHYREVLKRFKEMKEL